MIPYLRSSIDGGGQAPPAPVPHIVIVDEWGCRRARAAAFVLESCLEKRDVVTSDTCVLCDNGVGLQLRSISAWSAIIKHVSAHTIHHVR